MFFPQNIWWTSGTPDGVRYLCERWWELLRDWNCITTYSPPCSYPLSVLEDVAEVIDDLQEGRIRSCHQLDSLKEEITELLRTDQILRRSFPSEIASTVKQFDALYTGVPPDPQGRYAELKKRRTECRRTAAAAHRLHHRLLRRRISDSDMTWSGFGGIVGREITAAVLDQSPNYGRIDRLTSALLLDCLYRGYNLDYLMTLFDRYLSQDTDLRAGLLHVFRRINSQLRHEYEVFFVVTGATSIKGNSTESTVSGSDASIFNSMNLDRQKLDQFLEQMPPQGAMIVKVMEQNQPDAGAAADVARTRLQEMMDYWDFNSPTQLFNLAQLALVVWQDNRDKGKQCLISPSSLGERRPRTIFEIEVDSNDSSQLKGLAEALRWSSVARRERTPEVALLAAWFAFEFLAASIERTAVEGMMEYFPKALAIGNLRRRLHYWWRSVEGSPGFDAGGKHRFITEFVGGGGGGSSLANIAQLLTSVGSSNPSREASAIMELTKASVLLRERTMTEAKVFSNSQLIAQTLKEDAKEIQWELQRFLLIRNKLVHRARIEHPLLVVVSERAKGRLYDLLRDLSLQLTRHRLDSSVGAVLSDYRDTFEELLIDLGSAQTPPENFINRMLLA